VAPVTETLPLAIFDVWNGSARSSRIRLASVIDVVELLISHCPTAILPAGSAGTAGVPVVSVPVTTLNTPVA